MSGEITPKDSIVPVYLDKNLDISMVDVEQLASEQKALRLAAYQTQADPLYFGWQRGDNTEQEWLDAVQAVKDQYPYPDGV